MKVLIKMLLIFISISITSLAQWRMCGPYGGTVASMEVCDSLIFAGSWGNGLYVSSDSGATWAKIGGFSGKYVYCLLVRPYKIYAGTYAQGLYVSTDKGVTWSKVSALGNLDIYDISDYDGKMLASTSDGVWFSGNFGLTWGKLTSFPPIVQEAAYICNYGLFVGSTGYLYRSNNDGLTWQQLVNNHIYSITKCYNNLIIGTGDGIYLSAPEDSGKIWSHIGPDKHRIYSFSVNGNYAATDSGVDMTITAGLSWTNIGLKNRKVNDVEVLGERVFAGTTNYGVYSSGPMGGEWTNNNFPYIYVYSFAECDNKIFAGVTWLGVFFSSDTGKTWIQTELNNQIVNALAVQNDNIFAGTSGGVFLSTNKGVNWTQTSLNNKSINKIKINGNYIFASAGSSGLYRSTNGGVDWVQNEFSGKSVYALASRGDSIFAGVASEGIYLSTNNGTSWYQTSLNNQIVYSIAIKGNTIFAGTYYNGIYISTNGGTDWFQSSMTTGRVNSILIEGENIFAGKSTGVYLSTDNGVNWVEVNTGLTYPDVAALFVHKSYLFAGLNANSGWRRPLSEIITSVESEKSLPTEFSLMQNYPNPFNPMTTIQYEIPTSPSIPLLQGEGRRERSVSLKIYDIMGRVVEILVDEPQEAGRYQVQWNGTKYSSGIYYYELTAGDFRAVKKMILIK